MDPGGTGEAKICLNAVFADDVKGFWHAVQDLAGRVVAYFLIDDFSQRQ